MTLGSTVNPTTAKNGGNNASNSTTQITARMTRQSNADIDTSTGEGIKERARSYDEHQRDAIRLICTACQKPYDVTHAERRPSPFVCVPCRVMIPALS